MDNPKFTKFKDQSSQFRFNLRAKNGEIILHSEGYNSSSACDVGIASVKLNAPYDSNYFRAVSQNNQYYFTLRAGNGERIGVSEMYTSSWARDNGIEAVKKVAPTAPIEDLT